MVALLYRNVIGIGVLMLVVIACQPAAAPASPLELGIADTLTAAVETINAQATLLASPPVTTASTAIPAVTDSLPTATPPLPTLTFTVVFIPTEPPTITNTPSPAVPLAHITTTANCRSGPGKAYDIVTALEAGQTHVVVGRYSNTYLLFQPGGGPICWLAAEYALTEGNLLALAEYPVPPTPTPQLGWIRGNIKVKDEYGRIISIAGIKATIESTNIEAWTNDAGNYYLANVPVGEVTIVFHHSEYFVPKIANVIVRAGVTVKAPDVQGWWDNPHELPPPCRTPLGLPCPPTVPPGDVK